MVGNLWHPLNNEEEKEEEEEVERKTNVWREEKGKGDGECLGEEKKENDNS